MDIGIEAGTLGIGMLAGGVGLTKWDWDIARRRSRLVAVRCLDSIRERVSDQDRSQGVLRAGLSS